MSGRRVPKPRDVIRTRRREHWLLRHERELEEHQAEIASATSTEMRAVETRSGEVSSFQATAARAGTSSAGRRA